MAQPYEIRGGGSFPLRGARINASAPLVRIVVDDEGLSLRMWPPWAGRLAVAMSSASLPGSERARTAYRIPWREIRRLQVAPRSFVLWSTVVDLRFVAMYQGPVRRFAASATEHGVEIVPVGSTWRAAWNLSLPK
jgi:hypothetical protein